MSLWDNTVPEATGDPDGIEISQKAIMEIPGSVLTTCPPTLPLAARPPCPSLPAQLNTIEASVLLMKAPTRSLSMVFKVYRGQDQPNPVQLLPALSRGGWEGRPPNQQGHRHQLDRLDGSQ